MRIFRFTRKAVCSLVCAFAFTVQVSAQQDSIVTTSQDSTILAQQHQIDSLKQTMTDIQKRQKKTEKEANWDRVWKQKRYLYLSYVTGQTLTDQNNSANEWKSSTGFALSWGKTYYLHRKPLLGKIKFGIDWSWIDLSYVKYKDPIEDMSSSTYDSYGDEYGDDESELPIDLGMMQVDVAMRIGPSITVNPVNHLKVGTFFHFIPTASGIILDDEVSFGFAKGFSWGMQASYKFISLGFELRWASGKYNKFDSEEVVDNTVSNGSVGDIFTEKPEFKTSSFRLNVGFRF